MSKQLKQEGLTPYWDAQRRTCLMVRRNLGQVAYIPLITGAHIRMLQIKEPAFDMLWKPIPDHPTVKAVQSFVRFAQDLGATKEVMEALASMVKVSRSQREQAAAVLARNAQPPATRKGAY